MTKAQLYEVTLDQRLQEATTIIEGKITKQEAFKGEDGYIYTANTVQAFSTLKGTIQTNELIVITYGDTLAEETETWTHLLTFSKNDMGIFFLIPTNRPKPTTFENSNIVYEVYASSQGFLKYVENENRTMVAVAPFNDYLKNDILQNIRQITGQYNTIPTNNTGNTEDLTGVVYSIENVVLSNNILDFDIYVEGLWGSYDLTKSELLIEYDLNILGSNIYTNGVVAVTKGAVSTSPNYQLVVNDINPNELSIEIEATNTGFGLYTIANLKEQLVHIQITSPAAGNPDIEFDETNMQQLSEFLNTSNTNEVFQQVFAVGSIEEIGGGSSSILSITNFYPDTITAGTGDTLTIIGTSFGILQGNSKVQFTDAIKGSISPTEWITPLDSNYVFWSDTMIKVIVPSIGFINNTNTIGDGYAGTGKIKIRKGLLSSTISTNDLYIPYCLSNGYILTTSYEKSIPHLLQDANNQGGYDIYFNPNFKNKNRMVTAFSKALTTWRCLTYVNFQIVDTIPPNGCEVKFGSLPTGVSVASGTILGKTTIIDRKTCLGITSAQYTRIKRFSITFNDSPLIEWYTGNTNKILGQDTIDLESVTLHELGHAIQLEHTNNSNDLMFFDYGSTTIPKRLPLNSDLDGALHAINLSIIPNSPFVMACPDPMILINPNNCDVLSTIEKIDAPKLNLTIYPNPTSDIVHLKIDENQILKNNFIVTLQTMEGQVIQFLKYKNNKDYKFDLSSYPNGFYIITIQVDTAIYAYKVIKI